jgi:hypothetical protein
VDGWSAQPCVTRPRQARAAGGYQAAVAMTVSSLFFDGLPRIAAVGAAAGAGNAAAVKYGGS